MSELRKEIRVLDKWRQKHERVFRHFVSEGGAIHIQSDVVVRNANLRVFADALGDESRNKGNLIVGLGHSFARASNGFVAGWMNTIQGSAASVSGGYWNITWKLLEVPCQH